jgi:hypothetical protein
MTLIDSLVEPLAYRSVQQRVNGEGHFRADFVPRELCSMLPQMLP